MISNKLKEFIFLSKHFNRHFLAKSYNSIWQYNLEIKYNVAKHKQGVWS